MPERIRFARLAVPDSRTGDRLDSWKEIAAYLGREQRTVQRWEDSEGLPVRRLQHGKAGSVYALKSELDAWVSQRSGEPAAQGKAKRPASRHRVGAGILVCLTALIAAGVFLVSRRGSPPNSGRAVPLTGGPGPELEASLSPNGAQVAYVSNGEAGDNFDIYVRIVGGGAPVRLTNDPAADYSPAWSPDGSSIAFLRRTGPAEASVFVVSSLGGAQRRIAVVRTAAWDPWTRPGPLLAWSRDGRWLVTCGSQGQGWGDVLLRVSATDGQMQALTSPQPKTMGDSAPAVSPDGSMVAFSRRRSWGRSELCLLRVSEGFLPAGEVRTLETGSSWNASPAWWPDGRSVIFSTGSMDTPYLARIETGGSKGAQRLAGAGDFGWQPSVARWNGRVRLLYTEHFESVNVWRTAMDKDGGVPVRVISSAHRSYEPAWSPDGRRIAFLSDRTGYGEVWVAEEDGRRAEQWTFLKEPRLGSPRWSPDGRRIAFTAPGARGSSIFVIDGPGGRPESVRGSDEAGYLGWGDGGKAIYFSSSRGGNYDIWKVPAEGGDAIRVTRNRGRVPAISADGRHLYYLKLAGADGRNDLWRVPVQGGEEEKVLEFVDAYSLGETGIAFKHYRPGPDPEGPEVRFFRFGSGETRRLAGSGRPLRYGIALSCDGRRLLHAQADYEISELMLVEELR